jgi:hypothetical protein
MQLTEAATLDRKSGEADLSRRAVEGPAVPRTFLETRNTIVKQNCHLARPGAPWDRRSHGPPKVMKNASVRHPLFMEPLPFPCHPDRSEAERRDLRFRGPFVEMFFDRSVAQQRDLRVSFSSHADSEALMSLRAVWYGELWKKVKPYQGDLVGRG